jgi:hypothetical protein
MFKRRVKDVAGVLLSKKASEKSFAMDYSRIAFKDKFAAFVSDNKGSSDPVAIAEGSASASELEGDTADDDTSEASRKNSNISQASSAADDVQQRGLGAATLIGAASKLKALSSKGRRKSMSALLFTSEVKRVR